VNWFEIQNPDDVPSPALLLYPERIEQNLQRMLALAGGPERLRPHMKTHKLPELIRLHVAHGITRFKCATIAEAEMTAAHGGRDVLLAYQPVGPNIARLLALRSRFPGVKFSCVVDNAETVTALGRATSLAARESDQPLEVLLDLDVGQHRTGLAPDDGALALYRQIAGEPALTPGGLHAYDGHLSETDPEARRRAADAAFAPVDELRRRLVAAGLPVPRVIAGGTPTFPIHARRPNVECSPGTCVLWDASYASKLPDLNFLTAAVLLCRVVSKPIPGRLCLDLGHKAVASEMPPPRAVFLNLPDATPVMHSEEHLVVETPSASSFAVGHCLYAVPWHVCPTVALHSKVVIVRDGRAADRWEVTARQRVLTV
jgi:D-serine deaminase-like pyridoxal phosphate-dependent protein